MAGVAVYILIGCLFAHWIAGLPEIKKHPFNVARPMLSWVIINITFQLWPLLIIPFAHGLVDGIKDAMQKRR